MPAQGTDNQPTSAAVKKSFKSNYDHTRIKSERCGRCGREKHELERCPARKSVCRKCGEIGHWDCMCYSTNKSSSASASVYPVIASISAVPKCLQKSVTIIGVKGRDVNALWDTGSAENYIKPAAAEKLGLKIIPEKGEVALASSDHHAATEGFVTATLTVNGKKYPNIKLTLLNNACVDIILGLEFLALHKHIKMNFDGMEPPLVCALGTIKGDPPSLFTNLTPDCHPIASKSRRYSTADRLFIKTEVNRLLREGIIEESNSPWRSQPYVAGGGSHKKRLVIDYSETINRFTLLDAYPLPHMGDLINQIAQYKVFSTIDLQSAYHQIELKESDKPLLPLKQLVVFTNSAVSLLASLMVSHVSKERWMDLWPNIHSKLRFPIWMISLSVGEISKSMTRILLHFSPQLNPRESRIMRTSVNSLSQNSISWGR